VWWDVGVIDSQMLRQEMLRLRETLSAFTPMGIRSLGRFDQQESTRFHRDGGPAINLLVLGYEPTPIRSHLYLADPFRAARQLQRDPEELIGELMFRPSEEALAGHIVELPQPSSGHSTILIVNNSAQGLCLLHKAVVPAPDESQVRLVNSMMLAVKSTSESEEAVTPEEERDFLTTTAYRRKLPPQRDR
jgi:hypothetical protein